MTIQQSLDSRILSSVQLNHRDPRYIIVHPETHYSLVIFLRDSTVFKSPDQQKELYSYRGIPILRSLDVEINEFLITY